VKKNRDNNEQMAINGTEEGEILARLSERVEKAVAVIGELRRERDVLKARLTAAETKLQEHEGASERLSTLEDDCERFRKERGEIRIRIETMLSNLESLDVGEE
jgi:FtsZ-binding cell division protein ZapB